MFISPKRAIDEGWVKGNISKSNIQPNAIDFTIDHLYTINSYNVFQIDSDDNKGMRGGYCIAPKRNSGDKKDYWTLNAHTVYDGMSDFYVNIPDGVLAMLVVRSSFNRNGISIFSGLYDSGFSGHIGFSVHNRSGTALIEPGTRIGQILFATSVSGEQYTGTYTHVPGSHWNKE